MFDKTVLHTTSREYVPYEKSVRHEYAATTEQAKYLEKLNKQAWDSITDKMVYSIEDNIVSALTFYTEEDHLTSQSKMMAIFSLNGEKFQIQIDRKKSEDFYKNKNEILNDPNKRKAHNIVSNSIRDKKLFKEPCEVCGKKKVHAHHDDYTKPLNVDMRFFKHGITYKTKVFLRYRKTDRGLVFFIKVPDPARIEEDALNAYSDKVAAETELPIYKGFFAN